MDTLKVYWLAFKYWLGGTDWETSYDCAMKITFWPDYGRKD